MEQCITFFGALGGVEEKINAWLKEQNGKIKIVDRLMSTCATSLVDYPSAVVSTCTVCIFFVSTQGE